MDSPFRIPLYVGMPTGEDRERLAIAEWKRNRPQIFLSDDSSSSSGSDIGPLYCDPDSDGNYPSDDSQEGSTEEDSSDEDVGYSTF